MERTESVNLTTPAFIVCEVGTVGELIAILSQEPTDRVLCLAQAPDGTVGLGFRSE